MSALHMPALFPSATIRAFAMRLATKLLDSLIPDQVREKQQVHQSRCDTAGVMVYGQMATKLLDSLIPDQVRVTQQV